jgi:hypothetical protein
MDSAGRVARIENITNLNEISWRNFARKKVTDIAIDLRETGCRNRL